MIIRFSKLSKKFGDKVLFCDLDFSLSDGEVFGLVGKNGTGKSTLLNGLAGITTLDSGSLYFERQHMSFSSSKWKKNIGFVSDMVPLIDEFTAKEYLILSGTLYGMNTKSVLHTARNLFQYFFEDDFEKESTPMKSYSAGMRKKMQIIASILHKPKVIILDEPFNGLDKVTEDSLIDVIGKLRAEGHIILVTSHNSVHQKELCSNWLLIKDQKLIQFSTFESLEKAYQSEVKKIELNWN